MAERVAIGHLKINDENSGVDPKYDDNTKEKSPQTEASSRYDHDECIEKQKAARAERVRNWRLYRQQQFPNKDGDEVMAERVALGHLKINDENSGVDPKYDDNTKEKSPQTEASSRYDHDECIEKQKAAIAESVRNWSLYRQQQFPNKDGDEIMAELVAHGHLKINDENSGVSFNYDDNTKEIPWHDHDKCIEEQKAARAVRLRNWSLYRQRQFPNNDGDEFKSIQAQKEVPELSFTDSLLALIT